MGDKFGDKQSRKIKKKFRCNICDYTCCYESEFNRHLLTPKHKKMTNGDSKIKENQDINEKNFICDCGKKYKYRQGLHRHQQQCKYINKEEENKEEEKKEEEKKEENNTDYKELFMEAMMTMREQAKTINELQENNSKMIPLIGNNNNNTTNNQFNLQFYLNETCKDALNLTDFINSLQVQLKDLEYTADNGHIKGITNIFHTALSNIEETKRPMHCTDLKREVLYIKDNDEWHKDENKEEIKVAVNKVVNKNIGNQGKWLDAHPNLEKEEEMEKYIKMQDHSLGTGEEAEKNKIVKNILKEVIIKK